VTIRLPRSPTSPTTVKSNPRGNAVDLQDAGQKIDDAWEAIDLGHHEAASDLARVALKANIDAIDAYVALAFVAPTAAERQALLREGIRLGRAKFAAELKKPGADVWQSLAARPYMRAVGNLACELSQDPRPGSLTEAVTLAQHLLRIDPRDKRGMRFLLLQWLPNMGRWDEAAKLAKRYSRNARTEIAFWHTLHLFRAGVPTANAALSRAIGLNRYVVEYLAAPRRPDVSDSEWTTFGSRAEAKAYASIAFDAWKQSSGSIEWLKTAATR